jgi:hypothetical protein
MKLARQLCLVILALGGAAMQASAQQQLDGQVLIAGQPIVAATVTLWAASADAPAQLAQARANRSGWPLCTECT